MLLSNILITAITLSSCTASRVNLPVNRARYDALLEALKQREDLPSAFFDLPGQGDGAR
jgi:hypothetical protein